MMDNIIYVKNTEPNATVLVRDALEKVKKGVNNIIRFEKSAIVFMQKAAIQTFFIHLIIFQAKRM